MQVETFANKSFSDVNHQKFGSSHYKGMEDIAEDNEPRSGTLRKNSLKSGKK